jgi:hypothetical protein
VEAIQVAADRLELLDPFLGLGYHHVAVKCALSIARGRPVDVGADFGYYRRAKGQIRDEVAIPELPLGGFGV